MAHGRDMAIERYGQNYHPASLLKKIRSGEAKLVRFGHQGRLIYDVFTHNIFKQSVTVRVIVNPELTAIISTLPQKSKMELMREKDKADAKEKAKRKRDFFKQEQEDDENS